MLDISFIPAFKDNYIWLLRRGNEAIVVDPGDAAPVRARLATEGLRLSAILITHHHADHQGGVAELLADSAVPVYGPLAESITGCSVPLSGGECFELLGERFTVINVPGHTAGHIAYALPGAVFCGDTLFAGGCGRLFEGTPAQMLVSLGKLAELPDDTLIYCAHEYTEANLRFALAVEPENGAIAERLAAVSKRRLAGEATVPSSLYEERATNPFLRSHVPAVIAAAKVQGSPGGSELEVFTAIRAWKNVF
ncbi:MAG TPA: hydroxyacylglutathione hydrolase [Rhodocyclaceae bacterium]|nr:hydroxyacylglutathione hydrolase [Rhodocyclaceae bacterium]